MVNVLNEENFENEVLKFDGVVLVDFYADWCGPCKMMAPIVNGIAEENIPNVKVGKVNVDDNQGLAQKYNVMSIPTLIVFKNGNPVKGFVGVTDKEELKSALNYFSTDN